MYYTVETIPMLDKRVIVQEKYYYGIIIHSKV